LSGQKINWGTGGETGQRRIKKKSRRTPPTAGEREKNGKEKISLKRGTTRGKGNLGRKEGKMCVMI